MSYYGKTVYMVHKGLNMIDTLAFNNYYQGNVLVVKPTRQQVQDLKVGDLAIDCFGRVRPITQIYAQGDNIHGKAYVCTYVKFHEGSEVSMSFQEDEIVRTLQVCDAMIFS